MSEGHAPNAPDSSAWGRCRQAGFSLLELMIVMSVLIVAFLATSQSVVTSIRLSDTNRETALATDGARAMMEVLGGVEDFAQTFALYNDNPLDDPGMAGTAPGSAFAVEGLRPVQGDADGLVGEIVFPASGVELREDLVDEELGMPRDLNGDDQIDALDHSGDFKLLPVLVRLRWEGLGGEQTREIRTLLANR
jgi:prepilin-type N-terminal cleavage/methylation domain-containing protein